MNDKKKQEFTLKEQAESLFLKNYNRVRCTAFEVAPSRDLTDDIVHDTFIRFISKADQWDYSTDIVPLLCKMARNIAMEYWRNYVKSLPVEYQELEELTQRAAMEKATNSFCSDRDEELSQLKKCLEQLSPDHRRLLENHYGNHVSFTELAIQEQKNPNALQKMASRIRVVLRRCVEKALSLVHRGDVSHE